MITELVHQKTCKKNRVVTDINTGEIACMNCGAVLSERVVDSGPENLGVSEQLMEWLYDVCSTMPEKELKKWSRRRYN